MIARPEFINERMMRARKNFSSELTVGPRLAMAAVSWARAGDDTFVPASSTFVGTLELKLLIADGVWISEGCERLVWVLGAYCWQLRGNEDSPRYLTENFRGMYW